VGIDRGGDAAFAAWGGADRAEHEELKKSVHASDGECGFYPNGTLAAHVLGFTGYREEMIPGAPEDDLVGKSGIEAAFHPVLAGIPGWRSLLQDSKERELVALRRADVASRAGLGVRLTIDLGLQHIVESELETAFAQHRPAGITAIVVQPRTGAILAMANLPTFDPNAQDRKGRYRRAICGTGRSRTRWSPGRHSRPWWWRRPSMRG
jgi:cell division protein FtsI/penicillin-binding protein 2